MDKPRLDFSPSSPKQDRLRDVFLSHASEDIDIARRLCASLEESGWSVFMAARDLPGEVGSGDWSQRIDKALDECGMLILLTSPEALEKGWVNYEWGSFHRDILSGRGGWLVPCCVRELAPDQLERALRHYHIVDLRAEKDWETGIFSLVSQIEGYLKRPIAQTAGAARRSVLAIEGAAIRTMLAASVLERLEAAILQYGGRCLADYFDLIVGNSVGGALAARLAQGTRVSDCVEEITDVLRPTLRARRPFPFRSRFSSKKLVASLAELFSDAGLSAAPKCAISTFDVASGQHRLWSSHPALGGKEPGPSLACLTAASIAAPLYFDPISVEGSYGTRHLLVNGALWEADPCRISLEALRRLFSPSPLIGDIILVSVGSGRLPNPVFKERAPGFLSWVSLLPSLQMAANRQFAHEHVERLYRYAGAADHYMRFDPELPADDLWFTDDLDALPRIAEFGADWAESRSEQILQAAQQVMRRSEAPPNNSMQPLG